MTKKRFKTKLLWNIVAFILFTITIIWLFNLIQEKEIYFTKHVEVEYGEPIPLYAKKYIIKDVPKKVIERTKVKVLDDKKVENKDYQPVGDYTVLLSYKKQNEMVKVKVVDTTKPKLEVLNDRIEILTNETIDIHQYLKVYDLSDVTIEIDDTNVDYSHAGKYLLLVEVADTYGNMASTHFTVVVNLPQKNQVNNINTNITKTNNHTSNKANVSNNTNTNNYSNIPNGKSIALTKFGLRNPNTIDFGQYQDYATQLYQAVINNENYYLKFEFPNTDEASDFLWKVRDYMEKGGVELNSHIYADYGTLQENGLYSKNKYGVRYSYEETKDYGDLQYELTMAYNACLSAGLSNGINEKDAVLKIANWIKNHMIYDERYISAQSSYKGFKDGRGVCSTYAEMFKAMCDSANIECKVIRGFAKGNHAWNQVKVGNIWYYVDVTWYDTGGSNQYILSPTLWNSHSIDGIIQRK